MTTEQAISEERIIEIIYEVLGGIELTPKEEQSLVRLLKMDTLALNSFITDFERTEGKEGE
jgi:hypothetical protein